MITVKLALDFVLNLGLYLYRSTVANGSPLLDVGHLSDTGHSIQHVRHFGASIVAAAGTVYMQRSNIFIKFI